MLKSQIIVTLLAVCFYIENVTAGPIPLPSDPQIMGLNAVQHTHPETRESWDNLYKPGGFTDQTLFNFSNKNPHGILVVHSLEEIMGVEKCFIAMWNKNHPADQRERASKTFDKTFTNGEFVSHYCEYVLAQRYVISGSVIALSKEDAPERTLGKTFSPVNFILRVPPECIVATSIGDAHTPVAYAPLTHPEEEKNNFNREIDPLRDHPLQSLDALIRYPGIRQTSPEDETQYYNEMNEVAFSSCAVDSKEKIYRPEVVGVLLNHGKKDPFVIDYKNSEKNQLLADAAEEYAQQSGLPCLKIENHSTIFSKVEAKIIEEEWRCAENADPDGYDYDFARANPKTSLRQTFMLSPDQLSDYGLGRI